MKLTAEEHKELNALFKEVEARLKFVFTMPRMDDSEPKIVADIKHDLAFHRGKIHKIESALKQLPDDARPDQIRAALKKYGD